MSDIFNSKRRSEVMSSIAGKDTKLEILVRSYLFYQGFRYRKNVATLPGKPDIVLSKYKTVVFINGCFWHNHKNCKLAKLPNTRVEFWRDKLEGNARRDSKNIENLIQMNWHVIVIWQCQLSNKETAERTLESLSFAIKNNILCN